MPTIPRPLQIVLVTLSLLAIGAFLFTALSRIQYPYELEYMTGACLDHVDRILDGERVYVEPSADFVTWLYGPLYFYVCAGVSALVGESSLTVLRAVSLSCAFVTTVLAFWLVRRASHSSVAGVVAAGLWASTYGIVGTWWDIERVDSMFVMLLTTVLALLWCGKGHKTALTAGVLMTVTFMAKQTALVIAPSFAIGLAFLSWRRSLTFTATFAATLVPSLLVLDWLHDGWFMFYVWDVPRSHGYSFDAWWKYTPGDTLAIAPMVIVGAWYVFRLCSTRRVERAMFVGAWCSGIWLATWLARAHVGGAENSVIPTHLAFSLVAALALAEAAHSRFARIPITLIVLLQFACSAYDPRHYLPTEADREVGDRLVEVLRETEGPIMIPVHGHYARRTGHEPAAHVLAMWDVWRGPDAELAARMEAEYRSFVRDRGVRLVVLNEPDANEYMGFLALHPDQPLIEQILRDWEFEPLFEDPVDADGNPVLQANGRPLFMPVVGLQTRPRQIWRRKR